MQKIYWLLVITLIMIHWVVNCIALVILCLGSLEIPLSFLCISEMSSNWQMPCHCNCCDEHQKSSCCCN